MDARMTEALAVVRDAGKDAPFDEGAYLAAVTYLVDHRDALPYRVFIDLPGGMSGNADPRWARVKELTESRCNCGNERTILPLAPRTVYERSSSAPLTVRKGDRVYLKPVGGDKASTYIMLEIVDAHGGPAFTFMSDPFSGSLNFAELFNAQGYMLAQLAEVLPRQKEPAVMFAGRSKTPLFALDSADAEAGTVTIALDKDVEAFDPSTWKAPHA